MNANLCIGMVWNARGWTPPPRAYRTKSAQVRIGSGVAKPLDDIEDALRLWHGAGLLQTTHEDPFTPSRNFCFYFRGDALILKSQRCARKHRVGHACQVCLDGAAHKGLRLEAVKWASKIHLANYAHALAYGTATERRDMRAELRLQDVYQTREGRLEIESVLKEEQEAFQLQMIKHRWQSIRLDWRTSRLQAYIDAHIGSLPLRAAKEQQREVLRPRAACGFTCDYACSRPCRQLPPRLEIPLALCYPNLRLPGHSPLNLRTPSRRGLFDRRIWFSPVA